MESQSILERWNLTEQELTVIVDANPSLRGMFIGYVAEYKLRRILAANPHVTHLSKPDDHSRKKGDKNDTVITYKGEQFSIEVKSLQTSTIKYDASNNLDTAKAQVDASDSRKLTFPDGTTLVTTNLLRGEFDILAVNLFQFRKEWEFAFALNSDLPGSRYKNYTETQRGQLLATQVTVTLPIVSPYALNPFDLFDRLLEQRKSESPGNISE